MNERLLSFILFVRLFNFSNDYYGYNEYCYLLIVTRILYYRFMFRNYTVDFHFIQTNA